MKKQPKYEIGQKIILSIPRNDFSYKFDGRIGMIEKVNNLSNPPDYTIQFPGGAIPAIHFLESDMEPYKESLKEKYSSLKCPNPECGKGVSDVKIPDNNPNVRIVIFECMFSAKFDIKDNLNDIINSKLKEYYERGKMKDEFGG